MDAGNTIAESIDLLNSCVLLLIFSKGSGIVEVWSPVLTQPVIKIKKEIRKFFFKLAPKIIVLINLR